MPVGSILAAKHQQNTYQPLLLAAITFRDSADDPTVLLLSTHGLKTADGGFVPSGITGFPHNGAEFEARIKNQEIVATQALSENGIDVTPTVTLELADADKTMWAYEKTLGFKGAKLSMYYLFWDVGQNDFSTDYQTIFVGTCGPGKLTETTLRVQAVSRMNMNQSHLPAVRIQKRCPWIFPDTSGMILDDATIAQQSAADDPSSPAWHCGYSYLASGGNARGNAQPGGGHYQSCNYTLDECLDRLGNRAIANPYAPYSPIEKDQAGRGTARFGGILWDPPAQFRSRGYGQKELMTGYNSQNEGKYHDYVPMGWGTYWIDPLILNICGDANYTAMDVLLGMGPLQSVRKVIVNDIEVSKLSTYGPDQNEQIALQLFWTEVSSGDRTGACNRGTIPNSHGDPYGSLKVINVNVPRQLTTSSNVPRVRVLVDGPKIRKYQYITSITVASEVATATLIGPNTDIASNDPLPFSITGNTLTGIDGNYTSLTGWGWGPPGTIIFPCPGVADGTGTGGNIHYEAFTNNPAWVMMDALVWVGWRYEDLDIQTFANAALFYDESITYNGISGFVDVAVDGLTVTHTSGNDFGDLKPGDTIYINGIQKVVDTVDSYDQLTITVAFVGALSNVTYLASGIQTHARFKVNFGLSQRISGSDLIRQIRTACRSTLIPSGATGLLQLFPDQTLAGQQPSVVPGSNYNVAIQSKLANGTVANGYVAWKFDYSSILPGNSGGESSLAIDQLDIKDSPNQIAFQFYDEDNQFQTDSLSLVDSVDIVRVDQSVDGNIPVIGIPNFDQAKRVASVWIAKNFRGNQRGDTGGTYSLTFNTSFRCAHLRVGHIVLFDYTQLGIDADLLDGASNPLTGFLARVTAIKPTTNFQTAQITVQYDVDDWYVDSYEQNGFQRSNPQYRNALTRPSFPWAPYNTQPITGHAVLDLTDWQAGISQEYDQSAGNQALAQVKATGKLPINVLAKSGIYPPMINVQGTTASTGGTIKGGRTYYMQVCAVTAEDLFTAPSDPSAPCVVDVPAGTDTNTMTVPIINWPKTAIMGYVFAGTSRTRMTYQASVSITPPTNPASVTLTSYNERSWGIPDVEFNVAGIRGKRCNHAGIFGTAVAESTADTIKVGVYSDNQFTTNQFAPVDGHPYYIMLLGLKSNGIPNGQLIRTVVTTAGTVATTNNWDGTSEPIPLSSDIVGTGTSWNSGMVGKDIYISAIKGGNIVGWNTSILAVADSTHMTVVGPTDQDTETGLLYEIFTETFGSYQPLPVAMWAIESNTGDTFTLAAGSDTTLVDRGDGTTGLMMYDVVVVTMRPTIGTDATGHYIQDSNWNNALGSLGEGHLISGATNATPIVVDTLDNHGLLDRHKVYIQGVVGNTAANGVHYVNQIDANTFELYDDPELTVATAGNGTYTGGGNVQRQYTGMNPHEEKGNELYCIFGTGAGMWYKIKDNTHDRIYIDGEWQVTPDESSVFVINKPNWEFEVKSDSINNSEETTPVTFTMDVPNYLGHILFVQSFTQDGGGNEAFRSVCPWRMIYMFGNESGGAIGLSAIHITINGALAIGSDLGPITRPNGDFKATAVHIEVKQAPVGADIMVGIYLDTTLWLVLTILAGETFAEATDAEINALPSILAGDNVRVDITAVGTTTPGEDLAVSIYSN
jgi:hypothetical protein